MPHTLFSECLSRVSALRIINMTQPTEAQDSFSSTYRIPVQGASVECLWETLKDKIYNPQKYMDKAELLFAENKLDTDGEPYVDRKVKMPNGQVVHEHVYWSDKDKRIEFRICDDPQLEGRVFNVINHPTEPCLMELEYQTYWKTKSHTKESEMPPLGEFDIQNIRRTINCAECLQKTQDNLE